MNFFLGCDVSKAKLDVSLVNEQGIEQWFDKVANDPVSLVVFLLSISGHYVGDIITCAVESTACYHFPLLEATTSLGVPCKVINPILTKQGIKASVRGKKTDKTDALLIARMGLRGEGRLYTPEPHLATKYYVRGQQKLGEVASSLKRYETHLTNVLETEMSDDAREIMAAVQAQLKAARAQFIKDTSASAPAGLVELLRSIPGVGSFIAASLIGELQDIHRFGNTKSLIAFIGLDPKVRQSGKGLNSTGRLTKRGSPHLRRSMFIAANIARRFDPNMNALYKKKRDEGKSHTVATCVVARKLVAIVHAVWLRQTPYMVVYEKNI